MIILNRALLFLNEMFIWPWKMIETFVIVASLAEFWKTTKSEMSRLLKSTELITRQPRIYFAVLTAIFWFFTITILQQCLPSKPSCISLDPTKICRKYLPYSETSLKVALVQFADEKYEQEFLGAIRSVRCYAARQNYIHIVRTERTFAKNSIHFEKIYLAREALEDYDVVVSLDVEIFVANQTKRVEEFLKPNQDIYLSQRFTNPEIMSGAFIIKSSPWSKQWVDRWLDFDRTNRSNQNFDKGALIMLVAETLLKNGSVELKNLENI